MSVVRIIIGEQPKKPIREKLPARVPTCPRCITDPAVQSRGKLCSLHIALEAELFELVQTRKLNASCTDCGQSFPPYVMEFDHLPGHQKVAAFGRGSMRSYNSREALDAELAKCELVCRNCHSIRTYTRHHA